MPSSHLYHILFTLLILSQLHTALTNTCATGQYLDTSSGSNVCYNQAIVTANIRPTLTSLVYLVVFEGGTSPFTSASDFNSNVQFSLSSSVQTITTNPQSSVSYQVTSDFSVFQVAILATEVPYDTTMTVSFTDFTTDESRVSSIKSSVDITFASNKDLSTSDTTLVDKITDIDYILEIVWIGVSLLNPYWIIYMDCKLYRETLDIFKQVTVQYEPFMTSFYQANSRRTSGLRAYNLLQRYAFSDSSVENDWKKYGWTSVGLDSIDSDVLDDTQVLVNSQFFQFNDFAIFIDTFGSEITVIVGCIILAGLFELNFRILKPATESIYHKVSTIARQFFWGLLFMNALGSCQSLIYYTAIQFQAFDSEKTTHNKIGFAIALCTFIFVIGGVCAYVILSSKKKVFVNQMNANPQAGPLTFFDWILEFYKAEKLYQPAMILMVIVRSIVFSVIIITLNEYPVAQTAVLLGVTCVFMIGLVLAKPFSRKAYMVFKLIYEFVLFLALVFLLTLACLDNKGSFDSNTRSALNVVLISIWIAPPVLTIIFGAVGLIYYVKEARWGTGEKKSVKITPVNEERKIINKKKMIADEEQKAVKFEESPTIVELPTATEVKPQPQIFHPVPSSNVKNLEVPPVSILKAAPKNEVMPSNRTDVSSSNANLLQTSVAENNKMPASSLVLDQQNPASYAAQRNSMFLPRQQQLASSNNNLSQGAGTDRLVKNTSSPMPQGEMRPHIRNNSSNVAENKSMFALGGEQPRAATTLLGVPNRRLRYDVMELKLTPQSMRVIDQDGFKDFVSPKEGEGEHFISSRNNINA